MPRPVCRCPKIHQKDYFSGFRALGKPRAFCEWTYGSREGEAPAELLNWPPEEVGTAERAVREVGSPPIDSAMSNSG